MRAELEQKIQKARERLGLETLTRDQRAEQERTEALDDFKVFLAGRIDFWTQAELFIGAEYFWEANSPAVRFSVDTQIFVLVRSEEGARLLVEDAVNKRRELVRLAADDIRFEDWLLVGIGDSLRRSVGV